MPKTLRLTGNDVQVSTGTPIGLGDINLRVGGDLYLYKDPGQRLSVTGSLDQVSGTYAFQGRRFDIDETNSSINWQASWMTLSISPAFPLGSVWTLFLDLSPGLATSSAG